MGLHPIGKQSIDSGRPRCECHPSVIRFGVTGEDVLANGAIEQVRLLEHNTDQFRFDSE